MDFTASVDLLQTFENDEDVPIEAVYEFPLGEGITVCNFVAIVDEKVAYHYNISSDDDS